MVNGSALAFAIAVVLAAPLAAARPRERSAANENDLARDVQNPISKLTSVPLQNQAEFGIGPHGRVRHTFIVQPTLGLGVTRDVGVVSRATLPFVSRPELTQASGYTSGMGDIVESLLVVPDATADVLWGIGPSFLLPTATRSDLGTGKLGIGPTAALMLQPRPWMVGVVAGQMWSVAGAPNRPAVSQLTLMPVVTYNLPSGWYLNTTPVITANWNAPTLASTWTVPVGGGAGKILVVDDVPINVSVGAYWNAIRPDTIGAPSMSAQLQVALLFPR